MQSRVEKQFLNFRAVACLLFGSVLLLFVLSSCDAPEDDLIVPQTIVGSTLPESLWDEFDQKAEGEAQLEYLLDKVKEVYEQEPLMALTLVEHAELLSRRQDEDLLWAESLYLKALVMKESNPEDIDLQRALADVKISVEIFRKNGRQLNLARALNLQADIHYSLREEELGKGISDQAQAALLRVTNGPDSLCEDWGNYYRVRGILNYATRLRDSSAINYNH